MKTTPQMGLFQQPDRVLKSKLLAMMVLRVVLALVFLGVTVWFQIREQPYTNLNYYPLYVVVVVIGLLTIFYALALNRFRNLRLLAFLQIAIDIILITFIVYITGGADSYLYILYSFSVIGGSIILDRTGGYLAASVSSIAYGVLVDMDFYGMLPVRHKLYASGLVLAWKDVFTTVSTNILAFFTIAYLTGYLAERATAVERRLEEKGIDYDRLASLNRQIVENITSGIMTLDEELRITSFNREAERVTGFLLEEVYYKHINTIFPDIDINAMANPGVNAIRREKTFIRRDGSEIYLGFTISHGHGADMNSIVIFQDLTHLKVMEEQIRRDDKMRALGELSVGIAHEIRNPLASISGSIQVLKDDLKLQGDDLHLMEIVLRETARLNSLITDYLLFARPAQEKRALLDVGSVIGENIRIFKNCPEAVGIKIVNNAEEGMVIFGDIRQIGQVFWNLFLNAAHSMKDGGTLYLNSRICPVYTQDGAVARRNVEITVEDTGTGISIDNIERIFDPFFSTKDSGTGLGLAIVYRIIESHEGAITVRSALNHGSVFTITLPLMNPEEYH